ADVVEQRLDHRSGRNPRLVDFLALVNRSDEPGGPAAQGAARSQLAGFADRKAQPARGRLTLALLVAHGGELTRTQGRVQSGRLACADPGLGLKSMACRTARNSRPC